MTEDARIPEQALHVAGPEVRHPFWYEVGERAPESLTLAENRQPREPRLEAFEADLLVDAHVIGDWPAPLVVVIGEILGSGRGPSASPSSIVTTNDVSLDSSHTVSFAEVRR